MDDKDVHSSSKDSNIYCDLCFSTFGQSNLAEGFCVNCSNNLCANCCKYHKTLVATKDHVVFQDIGNPEREKPKKARESVSDKCVVHEENIADYYCGGCEQFCCSLCVKKKHNTCCKIELIADVTDGEDNANGLLDILQDISKQLRKNKSKLTSNEQRMKDLKEKARLRINGQREALVRLFEQIQADFENQSRRLEKESHSKLKSVSRLHPTLTSDLESLVLLIKTAQQEGKCEVYKAIKKANKELPLLQDGLKKIENDNDIETYCCDVSKKADKAVDHLKELMHIVQGACIRMHHS